MRYRPLVMPIPTLHLPPELERGLSTNETITLRYLCAGYSEKEIALAMRNSRHTVHARVKLLHRKLEVTTRSELLSRVIYAFARLSGAASTPVRVADKTSQSGDTASEHAS